MPEQVLDAEGRPLVEGGRVRLPDLREEAAAFGVVTRITDADGDLDDEGAPVYFPPRVHVLFDDGSSDAYDAAPEVMGGEPVCADIAAAAPRLITHITVHHTATTPPNEGKDWIAEHIEGMRRYCVDERGWADIAYHVLVDTEGRVWKGRAFELPPDSHTAGDWSGHLFVAAIGDFTKGKPTEAMEISLASVLGLCHGLWPGATLGVHSDYADTECPGPHLEAFVPGLIE